MASDAPRRIVFDANVLVSAFLFPDSLPGRALDVVLSEHRLLMSLAMAAELTEVLHRPKFDSFLTMERRDELLAGTIRDSEFIEPTTTITACRDPHDNKLLELAVDGNASAIVTEDNDLLVLHPFQGIPDLTPPEFLSAFSNQ